MNDGLILLHSPMPSRLKWFVEAEKTNARWAMMGVAGILGQELVGAEPEWWAHAQAEYWLPINAQVRPMED